MVYGVPIQIMHHNGVIGQNTKPVSFGDINAGTEAVYIEFLAQMDLLRQLRVKVVLCSSVIAYLSSCLLVGVLL